MNNHIQLVLKSSTTEMSLNDHESGIYIVPELEGLTGLPEIRTTSGVNSGYDGGWTSAQNFDARSITIRGVIANTDVATVERMRKQLVALLAQGKNETLTLNLVTEAGNSYDIEVRTIACEMAMQTVLQQQDFLIQLRADDPLIYDSSAGGGSALVQVQHAIGGFEINFELPLAISGGEGESVIQNSGLEQVYPIIKMYGALHRPTFVNLTTNQQIQLDTTLAYAEGSWFNPSETYTGQMIYLEDAPDNAPLASFQLDGETSQNGTPTPSAPVAVQTVTGENVVKICGKNLFDEAVADMTVGLLTADGRTAAQSNRLRTDGYIPVCPNTTYTLNAASDTQSKTIQAYIVGYSESGSTQAIGNYPSNAWYNFPFTFTTGANCKFIRISYHYTDNSDMNVGSAQNQQLELGSTATTYEPYQGQSYEVNLGKNLLDPSILEVGNITAQGVDSASTQVVRSNYIYLKAGNYALRVNDANNQIKIFRYVVYDTSKTFVSSSSPIAKRATITMSADGYLRLCFYNDPWRDISVDEIVASNVQLELGSTATSYAAYFEPIELCKIGDYQDYIYKSGGKWYVRKALGRQDVDTSGISLKSGYNNIEYGGFNKQSDYAGYGNNQDYAIWCSHALYSDRPTSWDSASNNGKIYSSANSNQYWLAFAKGTGLDNIKAALAGCVIYYPLATPTDTEITNEALIAQLEALLNTARTYAGTNNITTITPNEQGTLEISYYTDKEADRRDVVVIDSRMRTVTLNGIDIYHLIEEGSEFPMLDPGENKLVLRSDIPGDNGYAEVNYKQGYLSI